jgi:hypothetical protein
MLMERFFVQSIFSSPDQTENQVSNKFMTSITILFAWTNYQNLSTKETRNASVV